MQRLTLCLGFAVALLAGCEEIPTSTAPASQPTSSATSSSGMTAQQAARSFAQVTRRMEPVIESQCRARTSGQNCDFRIVVDDNPKSAPNAYQTLDENQRPLIVFTVGLIAMARNEDELAFVMGHEAAHHIEGHIARQQINANAGAVLLTGIAAAAGADATGIRNAQQLGQVVGARSFSKEYELEADQLGTILTHQAGYDPLRGSEFFTRIPDPGNRFLGTHPPNAQRVQIVRKTASQL
ncbi:peptidase M48 [Aliishimia ponticola]|uniref:Peptidase M48 n=1 Tax=Aliishimia ponticola TaxID=2499833 RepID=A0A4S4NFK4_9RHOB|nr:M48 family metallopeptidase [Aliishimia ponticola]THH38372.1 peptidase M48 [Aliishimia ponticola]